MVCQKATKKVVRISSPVYAIKLLGPVHLIRPPSKTPLPRSGPLTNLEWGVFLNEPDLKIPSASLGI